MIIAMPCHHAMCHGCQSHPACALYPFLALTASLSGALVFSVPGSRVWGLELQLQLSMTLSHTHSSTVLLSSLSPARIMNPVQLRCS
ncbi:hypothetical protein BJY04DRAFT_186120 [Aspergillus karnatakaensis]|uniref:uncharacterized protein n=1 Tax=Aspergillus karnatakaensis TaxID=1810916 RepID=UPI003CCD7651